MGIPRWPPTGDCPMPGCPDLLLRPDGIERIGAQGNVIPAFRDGERRAVKFLHARHTTGDARTAFQQEVRVGREHRSYYLAYAYDLHDLAEYRRQGWPALAIEMEYFRL